MTLLEKVLEARERSKNTPLCKNCKHLFWIDKETPFCKIKDKFLLPEYPPIKCELKEDRNDRKNLRKREVGNACAYTRNG
jgi:hypothetical protein